MAARLNEPCESAWEATRIGRIRKPTTILQTFLAALTICMTVLLGSAPVHAQYVQGNTVLTNARQVISLPREVAESRLPVRLEAVVTCYVPASQLCFVQDETEGVYVLPTPWPRELEVGDVVLVQGFTGAGLFSPIVQLGSIERAGRKSLLTPTPISLEGLNTGKHDSQLIVMEAVVREQNRRHDHTELVLANGSSRAVALIFGPQDERVQELVDARVRLTGVAGTFYDNQRLTGFGLFLQDWDSVEVELAPLEDPFAAPVRSAANLAWYSSEGAVEHRVRLRGTVTMATAKTVFLRDNGTGVRLNLAETDEEVQRGSVVEVLGFVRNAIQKPELDQVILRVVTNGAPPEPFILQADERLDERQVYRFLSVDGVVLGTARQEDGGVEMAMDRRGQIIRVHLPEGEEPAPGSEVTVSGVWVPPGKNEGGVLPGLWVADRGDLAIVAPPPQEQGRGTMSLLVAGVSALLAAVFLVAFFRARRETKNLRGGRASLEARVAEAERQLQQSVAVRERLAQDLHDHIIQSIYAVGLKVDDCAQQVQGHPDKVGPRLQSVTRDINAVIRDLRNVILGIETNVIQPQEFKTALKSLALTLSQDQPSKIRIDLEQAAVEQLAPDQATELVHLAREAVSNSLRHANAQTTTLRLQRQEGGLCFTVEDDGKGFDPSQIRSKGFGLRNMARRAENLGAEFEVRSEPGKGTIIRLDIPRQKQHF